jgi:hypothetical protein
MQSKAAVVEKKCLYRESANPHAVAESGIGETSCPPLGDALLQLAACADQLAAGDPAQPSREAVARYMDALELAIRCCGARPELGCWLDVLCPLKENLRSLCEGAESAEPARVDPSLVTAVVVLTHLALSLERQPAEALVLEVLLDVLAASVWSWPLPAAAKLPLRAAFGHAVPPSDDLIELKGTEFYELSSPSSATTATSSTDCAFDSIKSSCAV